LRFVICILSLGWVPSAAHAADTAENYLKKCRGEVNALISKIDSEHRPTAAGFDAEDLAIYLDGNSVCGQDKTIVDAIAKLLKSDNDMIRYNAALALASIGPPANRVVPQLKDALAQSDAELDEYFKKTDDIVMPTKYSGEAIRAALKRITGRDFPSYVQSREAEERRSNPARQ
jgi:HEAT repeats